MAAVLIGPRKMAQKILHGDDAEPGEGLSPLGADPVDRTDVVTKAGFFFGFRLHVFLPFTEFS